MGKRIRDQEGSSVILALVFLLLCMFTGGSVLAAASANAGRLSHKTQQERNQRSAMVLLSSLLTGEGELPLQVTIRDVTVTRASGTTQRTVQYLTVGGDTPIHKLLTARTAEIYEQTWGIPDRRQFFRNGERITAPDLETDAGEITLTLAFSILEEPEVLNGWFAFSEDGSFQLGFDRDSSLHLTLQAVSGRETTDTLTANGMTTFTRTRVIFWEAPVIGKGGTEHG